MEGTIALEQGNFAEAVALLEAALPDDGKEKADFDLLGRAYLGAGQPDEAERIFFNMAQDPDRFRRPVRYVEGLIWLGKSREAQGKKEEALDAYRKALEWWDTADFTLPEIQDAREAVARLQG